MLVRRLVLLLFTATIAASALADLSRRVVFGAQLLPAPGGGVVVGHVMPGSPADAAGVREGDVIASIAGKAVADPPQFVATVRTLSAGPAELVLRRDGEALTRSVALVEAPRVTSPDFDVVYDSVEANGALRRTIITRPRDDGRHPAVLFAGGIGCYSLDGAPPVVSGYVALIHELTRRGFVVMRVEKSGMGDSLGVPCQLQDFDNELAGYRAGFRKLATYEYVDAKRMFIVGHSIGGIVAPILAAELPARGVVAMSTAGQKWFDYEMVNARRQLAMEGHSGDDFAAKVAMKERCMRALLLDAKAPAAIVADEPRCEEFIKYPASPAYMQQVARFDPAKTWPKVTAKVLLVHGASDFVTDVDEHRRIERLVNGAHPEHATVLLEPNMDHFMREVASADESMKNLTSNQLDRVPLQSRVRADIAEWLLKNAR